MGQDCGSSFPPQRLSSLCPKLNHSVALSQSGQQDPNFISKHSVTNVASIYGAAPVCVQLPQSHVGGGDESHGWVCGLSNWRPALVAPPQKPCMKEMSRPGLFGNQIEAIVPTGGIECTQKRFLVFDQSGDQTTLIFSSGIRKPFEHFTSGSPKQPCSLDMKRDLLRTKEDLDVLQGMIPREEFDENNEPDVQSEMHEDTEELNALLYSDDESEDSDEEDEVTSSGHSPSTISAHGNQEASVGSTEGISAYAGHEHSNSRKLLGGRNYETPTPPINASNSKKRSRLCSKDENDAESSCVNGGSAGSVEFFLSSSNKKIKREKICETVSLLRSIVPGVEVEDPIFVLDRAIDYLKSLKTKAKNLGLDSLSSLEA